MADSPGPGPPQRPFPKLERFDDRTVAMWRALSFSQKLRLLDDLRAFTRQSLRHAERQRHPDWSDEAIEQRVTELMSLDDD